MGNKQTSEDIPEDTKIQEENKDLNPSVENKDNIEKKGDLNQEEPKLDPNDLNKEPEIKSSEKYPHDNPRHSKLTLNQKLSETKIIDKNINEQNTQDNKEPMKEVSYTANFYDKDFLNQEKSNELKNTNLEDFIQNAPQTQNQEIMGNIETNQNQMEIKHINTKANIEDLNINNIENNNNQNAEVPYMDNNLDINNMQKEEPYTFNNLDLKDYNNNIQTKEEDYTFNADVFQSNNTQNEINYTFNGQIFTNTDINNLNIDQYYSTTDFNTNENNIISNEYTDNINNIENQNYITPATNNEENVNYSQTLPVQYLPNKVEELGPNINDINYETNNNINNMNDNNNVNANNNLQANEFIQEPNVQNKETHFSERQNIYDQNPQEEKLKEKEKENQIENNDIINDPLIFDTVYHTQNLNIKESNVPDNDNNQKSKLLEQLHESKTLFIKDNDKLIPQEKEPGKEMVEQEKTDLQVLEEEKQSGNENNKVDIDNSEEIQIDDNKKEKKEDNKSNISNQIQEIKPPKGRAFEERDNIFNKNNIKVIKIEEEETQFCANLFSPLFKKLFG